MLFYFVFSCFSTGVRSTSLHKDFAHRAVAHADDVQTLCGCRQSAATHVVAGCLHGLLRGGGSNAGRIGPCLERLQLAVERLALGGGHEGHNFSRTSRVK